MGDMLTVYHGSKNGLEGPIRMVAGRNRQTCDFGQGKMGKRTPVRLSKKDSVGDISEVTRRLGLRPGADVRLALRLEADGSSFFRSSSRKAPSRSRRRKSIPLYFLLLCDVQGRLFELAWRKGFDMSVFVPAFMKSRTAALIDSTFNHLQWAGEAYILEELVAETGLRHGRARRSLPPEHLFWSGYLYRYWHCLTGETSKAIYKIADYRTMAGMYAGYHTLSNELAIENLTEDAKAA